MNTLHTALLLTHGVSTSQIKECPTDTHYYYECTELNIAHIIHTNSCRKR